MPKFDEFIREHPQDDPRQNASKEVVEALREIFPFLEVVGPTNAQDPLSQAIYTNNWPIPNEMHNITGWQVHYWPSTPDLPPALTCALNFYFLPRSTQSAHAQPNQLQELNAYLPSWQMSGLFTACNMMSTAHQQKWDFVEVIQGTEFMVWAAWAGARHFGVPFKGYESSEDDITRYDHIKDLLEDAYTPEAAPTPSAGTAG